MAANVVTYNVLGHDHLSCYEVVKALKERYVQYKQKYIKIRNPESLTRIERKQNKSPITTEFSLLEDYILLEHLRGDYAVGVFAGPKATKFICIDIDINDPAIVRKVIDTLEQMGIPRDKIYVSLSGGKGYHVDIYIHKFIYNNKARLIYEQMLEISGLDGKKVEFRPSFKQGVKLPLGIHQKTGQRCWYCDRETLEPIEDLDYIYETEFVEQGVIEEIADRYFRQKMTEMYQELKEQKTKKKPGGAHHAPSGFDVTEPGTRHVMQRKYAIYLRQHGVSPTRLYYEQMQWYDRQDKGLISSDRDEVEYEARGIAEWCARNVAVIDQEYMPKKAPVAKITQQDIAYILSAKTPEYRRVAFYLWAYCKRYGSVKVAYSTIASRLGISVDTTFHAVEWLRENKYLSSKRNMLEKYLKDSNRYELIADGTLPLIPKRYRRRDAVEIDEWITDKTFDRIYAATLSTLCRDVYLQKIMKPAEYRKYAEAKGEQNDRESQDGNG